MDKDKQQAGAENNDGKKEEKSSIIYQSQRELNEALREDEKGEYNADELKNIKNINRVNKMWSRYTD